MIKEYKNKCLEGNEPRIFVTKEFVQKHKFKINKKAISKLIKDKDDIFGFKKEVALDFLPFDKVKKYLSDSYLEAVEKGEEKYEQVTDVYEATQDFLDYMVFAWMKAMDERGLSASRSIAKLSAWMEILSREDIAKILEDEELYNPYGKRSLIKTCKILGINYPKYLEK